MRTRQRPDGCLAILLAAVVAAHAVAADDKKPLDGKKAVFIIAPKDFRDEELAAPSAVLKGKGCEVAVACSSVGPATGMRGAKVTPDMALKDVKVADYHAVVFVGGMGARVYFDDPTAHALTKAAVAQGKVLGAISMAPSILARAGLLRGKRATALRSQRVELRRRGARWSHRAVERHGLIVTANGPGAARRFGEALAVALAGETAPQAPADRPERRR